jgi:hypothetical protein
MVSMKEWLALVSAAFTAAACDAGPDFRMQVIVSIDPAAGVTDVRVGDVALPMEIDPDSGSEQYSYDRLYASCGEKSPPTVVLAWFPDPDGSDELGGLTYQRQCDCPLHVVQPDGSSHTSAAVFEFGNVAVDAAGLGRIEDGGCEFADGTTSRWVID